ncbi:MAG: hypothetical protein ACXWCZ_00510 [Flavisolibacter sp.]
MSFPFHRNFEKVNLRFYVRYREILNVMQRSYMMKNLLLQ